jgi:hypothetical protein
LEIKIEGYSSDVKKLEDWRMKLDAGCWMLDTGCWMLDIRPARNAFDLTW